MTVPLTGSQSLFVRLGHLAGLLNETGTATGATVDSRVSAVRGDFTSTQLATVDGLYAARDSARGSFDGWQSYAAQLAQGVIMDMVDADVPGGLPSKDIASALTELRRQMLASSDSIQRPATLTAVVTPGGSNTGNGVLIASVRDIDGLNLEYIFSETLNCKVTGGAAGSETLLIAGPPSVANPLRYNWPGGSNTTGLTVTATDASTTTLVANGNFENWSGSGPVTLDNWTAQSSAFGTSILRQSTTKLSGSYSLEFAGDGAATPAVRTAVSLTTANAVMAVNLWVRASASYTGGALAVSLVDSSDTVINDDQGNANTLTLTAGSASNSSWTSVAGFFRLPKSPPSTVYLRIGETSALQASKSLYIDRLAVVQPTQLYTAGPYVAFFSGGTNFLTGDTFTLVVTNSWSNTSGGAFARFLERTCGLRNLGIKLPSAASPTVSDTLVT